MSTADPLDIVLAYRTGSAVEAHSLADHLDELGIESQIVGDFLDGAYAGINLGRMGEKEVWVRAVDASAAKSLIADWEHKHHSSEDKSSGRLPWAFHLAYILALLFLLVVGLPARIHSAFIGVGGPIEASVPHQADDLTKK